MEFEDATTGSRNPSPSLPESAEFFADEAVTGYQGAGKSSLEQCAKMEAESTQRGNEAKGTPPTDEPLTNHKPPTVSHTLAEDAMDTAVESKVEDGYLTTSASTGPPAVNEQEQSREACAIVSSGSTDGAIQTDATAIPTDTTSETSLTCDGATTSGEQCKPVPDGATLSETGPAVLAGSSGISSSSSSSSSVAGDSVVLTETMLSEEQRLQERTSREGSTSSSVAELHQLAEQQRFHRLQHLLERSTVYSKFLLQRMESQAEEERRAQTAREKWAGAGGRRKGRGKPGSLQPANAKGLEEGEGEGEGKMAAAAAAGGGGGGGGKADAVKTPSCDGKGRSLRSSGVKGQANPEGRKTGGRKRKAEPQQLKLSDYMDSQGQLKRRKLDSGGAAASPSSPATAATAAAGPSVEEELQEDRYYNGQLIPSRQPRLVSGAVMRSYQLDGLEWIKVLYENGVNGILADEMGLGKTIQCISVIAHMIEQGVKGPFLVAAPLSTVPNWVAEFKRFTPEIPVVLYHGSVQERESLRRNMFKPAPKPKQQQQTQHRRSGGGRKSSSSSSSHPPTLTPSHSSSLPEDLLPVVVTSYEICMRDQRFLQHRSWKFLVVDEGHRIKNLNCKLIKALKSYDAGNRLLLTGTPLQNNLAELWSLLNFLLPDIFDDLNSFQSWFDFDVAGEDELREKIIAQEKEQSVLATLHQILTPFLLRRLKMDVEFSLPPKKEVLVYAPLTDVQGTYYASLLDKTIMQLVESNRQKKRDGGATVEGKENIISGEGGEDGKSLRKRSSKPGYSGLTDSQFEAILRGEASLEDFLPEEKEVKKVASSALDIKMTSVFMMLRKCCNHPYLLEFPMTADGQLSIDENLVSCCGKMLFLDRMLTALIKDGHKTLVFSQFTSMLDIIADYLDMRGLSFGRLDGTMKFTDRQEQMAKFKADPNCCVFILSTRAGGLGINLTSADTVIIYDSDWNPQADLQAMDRCHRIGQTQPVMVYRFVTGNTIDQRIVERASSKRRLEKMVIHKGRFKGYHVADETLSLDALVDLLHSVDHDKVANNKDAVAISDEALAALLDRSTGGAGMRGSKTVEKVAATTGSHQVFKVIEARDTAGNITVRGEEEVEQEEEGEPQDTTTGSSSKDTAKIERLIESDSNKENVSNDACESKTGSEDCTAVNDTAPMDTEDCDSDDTVAMATKEGDPADVVAMVTKEDVRNVGVGPCPGPSSGEMCAEETIRKSSDCLATVAKTITPKTTEPTADSTKQLADIDQQEEPSAINGASSVCAPPEEGIGTLMDTAGVGAPSTCAGVGPHQTTPGRQWCY